MIFVSKLKVLYSGNLLEQMKPITEHILIIKSAGQVLVQQVSSVTKKQFSTMRTF